MRLKTEQVEKLSQLILRDLTEQNLITAKASSENIQARIEQAILQNFADETKLEAEVEEVLQQFRSQIQEGQLNERELFLKIKKELAKKKKLII